MKFLHPDVLKVLKKIKAKKGAGPDDLTWTFIKDGAKGLAAAPAFLINKSLWSGEFPNTDIVLTPWVMRGGRG